MSNVGRVIELGREIEHRLKEVGAVGTGLGETIKNYKTIARPEVLSDPDWWRVSKALESISIERNRCAHDHSHKPSREAVARVKESVELVLAYVDRVEKERMRTLPVGRSKKGISVGKTASKKAAVNKTVTKTAVKKTLAKKAVAKKAVAKKALAKKAVAKKAVAKKAVAKKAVAKKAVAKKAVAKKAVAKKTAVKKVSRTVSKRKSASRGDKSVTVLRAPGYTGVRGVVLKALGGVVSLFDGSAGAQQPRKRVGESDIGGEI